MKALNIILKIGILVVLSDQVFSQDLRFENGFWMPKSYINFLNTSSSLSDTTRESLIKPIVSIFIKNNQIWVRTYKSEFYESAYTIINANQVYLNAVKINLATPVIYGDRFINKLINGNFYLVRNGKNNMSLVIKRSNIAIDSIPFSRFINNHPIISDDVIKFQHALNGKFDLFDYRGLLIKKDLKIDNNGKISNSSILNRLILRDLSNVHSEPDIFYVRSELWYDNEKKEKIILKFSALRSISIYEDNQDHLGKMLYLLKRIE